jgi:predicted enzyme related to lactoylglutathione lyase
MSDPRGKFLWYELMTTDVDAAKAFYTEVVGWRVQNWEGAGEPYSMWMAGEVGVGGMMTLPEQAKQMGAPPHWIAYVGTPNVDATVAQVKKLGGKVYVEPMDIPKVGRFATIADPQGAVIAAFQPAPPSDPNAQMPQATGPGAMMWHELMTSDPAAAWGFYEALFGWAKTEAMDMGPMGTYQMFGLPGEKASQGGIMNVPAEAAKMGVPPHWLYYTTVADLSGSLARVSKLGGKVTNGPTEIPGGDHIAGCLDPQGAAFALHEAKK